MRLFAALFLLAFAGLFACHAFAGDFDGVVAPAFDAKQLALHAAGFAATIRLLIGLLRSPIGGAVWLWIPLQLRPFVVLLLGALAAIFDHLALGQSVIDSIAAGLGGSMIASGSHSMQSAVTNEKARKAAKATALAR